MQKVRNTDEVPRIRPVREDSFSTVWPPKLKPDAFWATCGRREAEPKSGGAVGSGSLLSLATNDPWTVGVISMARFSANTGGLSGASSGASSEASSGASSGDGTRLNNGFSTGHEANLMKLSVDTEPRSSSETSLED